MGPHSPFQRKDESYIEINSLETSSLSLRAEHPSSLVSGHLHIATVIVLSVLNGGDTVDSRLADELDSLGRSTAARGARARARASAGEAAVLLEDAFRRGSVGICKGSLLLHGGEASLVEFSVASSWAQRRWGQRGPRRHGHGHGHGNWGLEG